MNNNKCNEIPKSKKPIWKRWYFWFLIIALISIVAYLTDNSASTVLKKYGFTEIKVPKGCHFRKYKYICNEFDALAIVSHNNTKLIFNFKDFPKDLSDKIAQIGGLRKYSGPLKAKQEYIRFDVNRFFKYKNLFLDNYEWKLAKIKKMQGLKPLISGISGDKELYAEIIVSMDNTLEQYRNITPTALAKLLDSHGTFAIEDEKYLLGNYMVIIMTVRNSFDGIKTDSYLHISLWDK